MRFKKPKVCQGFTLIEFIVYIAIVVVILVVSLQFGWEIIFGNIKAQAQREVQQNLRVAMEKMARIIEEASSINSPAPGNSAGSLSLEIADLNRNPTVFEVVNGKLYLRTGVEEPYELTNNRVKVSNLQFTNLSYPDNPGVIQVKLKIEHINSEQRNEYAVSLNSQSTVSLPAAGVAPPVVVQSHYRWRNDDGGE